ncbi:MAG TPA: arabinose transporter permease, partial [Bacillota bacterium]|nr:arabinose transporter permease [Bacillota bacterium]
MQTNMFLRKNKSKPRPNLITVLSLLVLGLFGLFTLAPFYFMLVSSFKPGTELVRNGINLQLPLDLVTFKNYALLFTGKEGIYLHWYKNSLIITFLQTTVALFFSAMVGYGLGVYRFRGRNLIFICVLLVMMVPIEILILPLYQLATSFRLIDTYAGAIFPFAVP